MVISDYEKLNWVDKTIDFSTPIVAARLNHNDDGVYENREYIKELNSDLLQTDGKADEALGLAEETKERADRAIADSADIERAKESAEASAESARESAERAMSTTPEGYNEIATKVMNMKVFNAVGESLELDTAEGGIRINEIDGQTHKSANLYKDGNVSGTQKLEVNLSNPLPIGTYTMSLVCTSTDTDKTQNMVGFGTSANIIFDRNVRNAVTLTTTSETTKLIFYASKSYSEGSGDTFTFTDIQIEKGSTATSYEPYGMHSCGELGCVDLGSLTWTIASNTTSLFRCELSGVKMPNSYNDVINGYCQRYKALSYSVCNNQNTVGFAFNNAGGSGFEIYDNSFTSASDFKSAMNGVYLAYEVADGQTADENAIVVEENGANLWDEEWELGGYNLSNGATYSMSDRIRSTNFFKVKPSTNYKVISTNNIRVGVLYYKADGTYIGNHDNAQDYDNITTPSECTKMHLFILETSYNYDVAIYEGTEAKPYQKSHFNTVIIPLSAQLRSIGNIKDRIVYKNGKWYENRKLGSVDMGTVSYTSRESGTRYTFTVSGAKRGSDSKIGNILCEKYETNSYNYFAENTVQGISIDGGGTIAIWRSGYSSTSEIQTAMSGQELIYELATETFTEITDSKALYLLESYKDKTYIDSSDGLAILNLGYGKEEVISLELDTLNNAKIAQL